MVVLNRFEWNNIHPVLVFSFKTNVSMTEEKHSEELEEKVIRKWVSRIGISQTAGGLRTLCHGKMDESDLTAVKSMSGVCDEHSCACIQHSFGRKVDCRGNCFTITPIDPVDHQETLSFNQFDCLLTAQTVVCLTKAANMHVCCCTAHIPISWSHPCL